MKIKILLMAAAATLLIFSSEISSAQQTGKITVEGTVVDESGEPVIGAGVLVKNTVNGVITDVDGHYSITVNAAAGGGVLVFSSLGYEEQEIEVKSRTTLNVVLAAATNMIDDVVVVGYGTQKRSSVVGAISTINASDLRTPTSQLSSGLAGQLSGIIAVQTSGKPGANNANFYIRGVSSFQGSVNPLVLVDGIERNLNLIDTEDIESFSILKDASASAVYGVRGANGVILIKTKSGSVGKPQINLRAETGITQPLKIPSFVNAEQFAQMYNWATNSEYYTEEDIEKYRTQSDPDLYPDVDWIKTMYKDFARLHNIKMSVSGGTETVRYFVSGIMYNESSIYRNAGNIYDYDSSLNYKKYYFRANLDLNLTSSTVLLLNLANIYESRILPGSSDGNIWSWAFSISPNSVPKEYSDGTIARPSGTIENPWNLLVHTGYQEDFCNTAQSVVGIKQDLGMITEGLTANVKFSWDAFSRQNLSRTKTPTQFHAKGRDEDGNLIYGDPVVKGGESLGFSNSSSAEITTYLEGSVNYERLFNETHRIGALFLYNHKIHRYTANTSATNAIPYKNQGIAGRLTYAYKDKYFAEFNVGYNGSENFAPGHRFGFFPAFSAGYLISEEPFWKPVKKVVNMLKFKASYGLVGNDQIGGARWLYLPTVIGGNSYTLGENGSYGGSGLAIGRPENLDFSWEKEKKLNIGVEFELFNQLRIMSDFFDCRRSGILIRRAALPGIAGLQNGDKLPYVNIGETWNKGFEVSMEWHKKVGEVYLTSRGNFTYNRNNLVNNDTPDWEYKYENRFGRPFGTGANQPWAYVALGLFQSEEEIENSPKQTFGEYRVGDIKYQDVNGDGEINSHDRIYLGYPNLPEITYGFGLNAEYKGWDINAFFQGISHINIFIGGTSLSSPFSNTAIERAAMQTDLWEKGWSTLTNNGKDLSQASKAVYPRLSFGSEPGSANNNQTSSWWQRDGSFLRLKNFEIGYTIPKSTMVKIGIAQHARFYVAGTNVLTFSKFKLWDPEQGGGQGASYPNNRIWTIGVNVKF